MDKNKKHALIIGAILALIIIWFLLFRNKSTTVLFSGDNEPLKFTGLSPFNISLSNLVVPNLGEYIGVSSCGCSGGHLNVASTPNYDTPARIQTSVPAVQQIQPIGRTTPQVVTVRGGRSITSSNNYRPMANGRTDASGRYADGSLSRLF